MIANTGPDPTDLPAVFTVRQTGVSPVVDDVAGEVRRGLQAVAGPGSIRPGDRVAITAGSRGIANAVAALRAVADHVRDLGGEPFIVPAMGSHGGATAEGQQGVLASYGVTEEACGCPVRSSMEVVEVGVSALGFPIVTDRLAHEADHVIVCNRVKPHTMFSGRVESGLTKMLLIGLGKHEGAVHVHRAATEHGWDRVVADLAPRLVGACSLLAGVALLEGSSGATARVAVVAPDRLLDEEPALLDEARALLPRLPFDDVDLLLVDEIGKDVSGVGFDVNVVGRKDHLHHPAAPGAGGPRVTTIAVRGLTAATKGNALGIGLAELCRSHVLREMDLRVTRVNALTAGDVPAAMLPIDFETDAEIVGAALPLFGLREPRDARILWIRNTARVEEVVCSAAYRDEAERRDDLEIVSPLAPFPLGADGNLPDHPLCRR